MHRIRAVNTAPDSENRMHDDSVAAQYGFRGGLVPGVTVYGYMTIPVLEHFGPGWLNHGAMHVRFREPVYDGEEIAIESRPTKDGRLDVSIEGRATAAAWIAESAAPNMENRFAIPVPPLDRRPTASRETLAPGVELGTLDVILNVSSNHITDPLAPAIKGAIAHPAVLLSLANEVLMRNVTLGPWIHAASTVTNFSAAHDSESLRVHARVTGQFERKGHEFAVVDVIIAAGGRAIQHVMHTVIWRPRRMRYETT